MNGWIYAQRVGWLDEGTDGKTAGQMEGKMGKQMDIQKVGIDTRWT